MATKINPQVAATVALLAENVAAMRMMECAIDALLDIVDAQASENKTLSIKLCGQIKRCNLLKAGAPGAAPAPRAEWQRPQWLEDARNAAMNGTATSVVAVRS